MDSGGDWLMKWLTEGEGERSRKRSCPGVEKYDSKLVKEEVYKFQVLLPNGISVGLKIRPTAGHMPLHKFVDLLKLKYFELREPSYQKRRIQWTNEDLHVVDAYENKIRRELDFSKFTPNTCHILRLNDGSAEAGTFENMWDLTPHTDLLIELPEEYTFESALADLIDNSLQAVWSNASTDRKLISVKIAEDCIEIFDTGPGMDGSPENSIVKWGKMGASLHRLAREHSIGTEPPYLMPFFGMFGFGGPIATMHLGRCALVCSKTKQSKKVYKLHLEREALLRSNSEQTWRAKGGLRDPKMCEIVKAPHLSFTKVQIFEPRLGGVNLMQLQCRLKDIYFPYIQCDELSRNGQTIKPIEFQINGMDLAEVLSGEVAVTNMHSCNGQEFILQLHFTNGTNQNVSSSSPACGSSREANARLKCVYFPIIKGKESIESILEKLKEDGCGIAEDFKSFSRVSVRRLGRLLPDARWAWLPFMEPKPKRGEKAQFLKRCCYRVKCFIDTDGGFNPTSSKTDLAHQNPFTIALKDFGKKHINKPKDIHVAITKDGQVLTLSEMEKQYEEWISYMHNHYDEEMVTGNDEPMFVIGPSNKKDLGISSEVIRVHKLFWRKEALWSAGQKIKILKGACAGFHRTDTYATLEYIILEGLQGDAGCEARLICRPIDVPDENGCVITVDKESTSIRLGGSVSLPISVIDFEKCIAVDDTVWQKQIQKRNLKILGASDCHEFGIGGKEFKNVNCEKRVQVSALSKVESWGLLCDKQVTNLIVRVGSCLPPLSIACFDKYNNRLRFPSDLKVMIKLSSHKGFTAYRCNMKAVISSDELTTTIKDVRVVSSDLDKIRPSYNVNLFISPPDELFSVTVPVQVFPGAPHRVSLDAANFVKQLVPGEIIKDLVLEVFDEYDNHVKENELISLQVDGLHIQDGRGLTFKANQSGCVDLCRLLKVVRGFGQTVSFSVISDNQIIFKEVFQTEGRELRAAFEMPIFITAGSPLENLVFEVVKTDGGVDRGIHSEGKNVRYHTLRIISDSLDLDDSLKYGFNYGRCTIQEIPHQQKEGKFCFKATHSHHPELTLNVEVHILKQFHAEQEHSASQISEGKMLSTSYYENQQHVAAKGLLPLSDSTVPSAVVNLRKCVMNDIRQHQINHENVLSHISEGNNLLCKDTAKLEHFVDDPHKSTEKSIVVLPNLSGPSHIGAPTRSSVADHMDEDEPPELLRLKELEVELKQLGLCNKAHEMNILSLILKQSNIEQYIAHLQDGLDVDNSLDLNCAPDKESIMKRIVLKIGSAAAVICRYFQSSTSEENEWDLANNIVGVVACLVSVPTNDLSRVLAQYLGEDQMLGIVCNSYIEASQFEKHGSDGTINDSCGLHALASTRYGMTIQKPYDVFCLENIRPYTGEVSGDSQRKLVMPNPLLPNGKSPIGFLGYAVNMVDVDTKFREWRTASGHGLRETLFYRLFGKLQVYETRQYMSWASPYTDDSAVSLDGGILRGNGVLSLGYGDVDVQFPVNPVPVSPRIVDIRKQLDGKKEELKKTHDEVRRELDKRAENLKKFQIVRARIMGSLDNIQKSLTQNRQAKR